MITYKIVRMFLNDGNRDYTILTGLTYAEARAHCNDPETSSHTCTGEHKRSITRKYGPWFEGFLEETPLS